jgi:CheY-like chemotaxis protein
VILKGAAVDRDVEILLVEDDPKDVELTLHALRAENLADKVHVARDGEEALEFLSRCGEEVIPKRIRMPKLVLLDLKLPKVDGLEVIERMRADPITRLIPVVVLTSSKQDDDIVESYRKGVNSYLHKPVTFDEFRTIIRELGLYWLLANQVPSMPDIQKSSPGMEDNNRS